MEEPLAAVKNFGRGLISRNRVFNLVKNFAQMDREARNEVVGPEMVAMVASWDWMLRSGHCRGPNG
jgi:hypothetical protein